MGRNYPCPRTTYAPAANPAPSCAAAAQSAAQSALAAVALSALLSVSCAPSAWAADDNKVNVWNWSDYIAADTVDNFKQDTGMDINYVLFDSNELVEARLLSGSTGFDAIMMTSYHVPRLAQAGALDKFDKSLIPNYDTLDPNRMALLATLDPGNQYAIPYTEISLGIGYNTEKIKEIFGPDFKVDSWDLLFKPENSKKLKQCGIAVLDSPFEVISTVQHYLGKDPQSEERSDYNEAQKLLIALAQNVAYFHSSRYINDLASGDICVAIGYSGDILQAKDRAQAAHRPYDIEYVFPKEGSLLWFDCWIMPMNAPHYANGHKWINYLMEPDVAATISKETRYILPVKPAIERIDPALKDNTSVNLTPEMLKTAYFPQSPTARQTRAHNRVWNAMKLNSNTDSEWE